MPVSVAAISHLPDDEPEHAVALLRLEQLVARERRPARDVRSCAGVGREQLEEVASLRPLQLTRERDEGSGARLPSRIDDLGDDIHGKPPGGTGTWYVERQAAPLAGTAEAVGNHRRHDACFTRADH